MDDERYGEWRDRVSSLFNRATPNPAFRRRDADAVVAEAEAPLDELFRANGATAAAAAEDAYPHCFYTQMLAVQAPPRSVSQPPTPTGKLQTERRARAAKAASAASATLQHSTVALHALHCTEELQELLRDVRQTNALYDELRRH
jgi:hypothetical protein